MADLINREALIDIIRNTGFSDNPDAMFEEIMEIIEAQPTAYDIEKVVAELEKYEEQPMQRPSDIVWNNAINMCLEIVRKGGVE